MIGHSFVHDMTKMLHVVMYLICLLIAAIACVWRLLSTEGKNSSYIFSKSMQNLRHCCDTEDGNPRPSG
jgi:uncharacterized membrane protein YqjE